MIKKVLRRANAITVEFENMILRVAGYVPFHHIRRFFYRLGGMRIGKGSTIHMFAVFYNSSRIKIGEDTIIGEWVVLDGRDDLIIGDHVDIATGVMIYNAEHDINSQEFAKASLGKVTIEDYVFIGPRAIILPGVKLGKGAVVGAGAVVTKDVEELSIVGGVPAKEIGKREKANLGYKLGRASWFR